MDSLDHERRNGEQMFFTLGLKEELVMRKMLGDEWKSLTFLFVSSPHWVFSIYFNEEKNSLERETRRKLKNTRCSAAYSIFVALAFSYIHLPLSEFFGWIVEHQASIFFGNSLAFSTNVVGWKEDFGRIWSCSDWKEEGVLL